MIDRKALMGKKMSVRDLIDMLAGRSEGGAFEKAFSAVSLKAAGIDIDAAELTRLEAAILLHKYMLEVDGITDLEDISGASVLKDLYDCRKCVNHIAQVYLRGLMKPVVYPLADGSEIMLFDGGGKADIDDICGIATIL